MLGEQTHCVLHLNHFQSSAHSLFLPHKLSKFICKKGSVAIDGVSLTVNNVNKGKFSVNLIPHTYKVTTLGNLKKGDKVNIEIDVLARYVNRNIVKD